MGGGLRRIAFDCIVAIGAFVAASVFAGSAIADDAQTCEKASGDVAIAACTRSIESGQFTGHNLAVDYSNRGVEYKTKGDYDHAIADYNDAIRLDPKYTDAYYNWGIAKRAKGGAAGADADVAKAKQLDPNVGN
jgi:tetratricopeptide (TPR) repeat protein